tara:strand:- start:312 stop:698 length:387 start_codon:yes stop_codon:yes gene_type:complete
VLTVSGIFGNLGRSTYSDAKMVLVRLMNVPRLEGERKGIYVNCLAFGATTRMTESLNLNQGRPSPESPAVLHVYSRAPNHTILQTLGAQYARVNQGIDLEEDITYGEFLDRADNLMGDDDFRSRDGCG